MKVSCEEATKLCTIAQYGRLSIVESLKLNYHLFVCKVCGRFSKQNKMLTKCIDEHIKYTEKKYSTLSDKEKEVMSEEIKREL